MLMTKDELQIIYSKKIRPIRIVQKIFAYLSAATLLFFIVTAITRCSSGDFFFNFNLKVSPFPLNEIPANVAASIRSGNDSSVANFASANRSSAAASQASDSWASHTSSGTANTQSASDSWGGSSRATSPPQPTAAPQASASNRPASRPRAAATSNPNSPENIFWKKMFEKYALKIKIDDAAKYYRIDFRIGGFPRNNRTPSYAELAFEVYNSEKDYLFTFYADNYWHQSGYDDGYWHQWNYVEKLKVNFPKKGEYYIVCAASGQYRTQVYQIMQQYSYGSVKANVFAGVKPFSTGSFIFALISFIFITTILFAMKMGTLPQNLIVSGHLNFEKYNYIAELPSKTSEKNLFQITGYIRTKNKANYRELILTKDGMSTFLETERETEDEGDSKRIYYYFYYYDEFPDDLFEDVPSGNTASYKGKTFYSKSGLKEKTFEYHYANGLKESVKKSVKDFAASRETEYMSFEYTSDPKEFDVSYGYEIKDITVWKVAKK